MTTAKEIKENAKHKFSVNNVEPLYTFTESVLNRFIDHLCQEQKSIIAVNFARTQSQVKEIINAPNPDV